MLCAVCICVSDCSSKKEGFSFWRQIGRFASYVLVIQFVRFHLAKVLSFFARASHVQHTSRGSGASNRSNARWSPFFERVFPYGRHKRTHSHEMPPHHTTPWHVKIFLSAAKQRVVWSKWGQRTHDTWFACVWTNCHTFISIIWWLLGLRTEMMLRKESEAIIWMRVPSWLDMFREHNEGHQPKARTL